MMGTGLRRLPCDGNIVEGIEEVATDCNMGLVVSSKLSRDAYLFTC